jgi:hypothetical protein
MSFYTPPSSCQSFEAALAPFLTDDGLPFADVLPAEQVRAGAFPKSGNTPGS